MALSNARRTGVSALVIAVFLALDSAGPSAGHDTVSPVLIPDGAPPVFDFTPPVPGSYRLPVIREAVDGTVLDIGGRPLSLLQRMAGRVVLLSFIYTNCERECPHATSTLYDIFYATAADDDLPANLSLISLSFDPERDTPEAMAAYGYAARADPAGKSPWSFFTTRSRRELEPILRGYGQNLSPRPSGVINHLLRVYLIDRRGRVRNIYGLEFLDPRLLLVDVRTLLLEEAAAAARSD